ncbi:MAG: hydroxyacid dehydrogenase [Candidatus Woesearchaeota archaeon]
MFFKKKIAFFALEDWEREYVKKNLKGFDIKFCESPLTLDNASKFKDVQIIGIFIYSNISSQVLDKLPKLKMIATLSTGYDHIDLRECEKRNILVCNVPFYGENTVAEHTFALILALSRKVFQSIERTKKGEFTYEGLTGFDLKGKTLGLVGTGHISAHVARIAYGFEMNIIGYDIRQDPDIIKNYGLKYVELDTLLKNSDIVSLHLPLNDKTKYTINKKNISLMKPSALIINTARGGLIDTDALVKALQTKKIGGAGLDVLEEECAIKEEKQILSTEFNKSCNLQTLLENHILLQLENVVVTPHNAFNSIEALRRIIDTSIENIRNFSEGKPQNVISPKNI